MNLWRIASIKPLYRLLMKARWVGGRCVMRLCHALFGVRGKRVFFSSFIGRGYTDSPARICEALHALRPDAELVWQLKNPAEAPDYVRVVRPRSLSALWAISTARCLVDNFNRQHYMLKFDDQKYVQTWHGDRGFKKMLFDMDPTQRVPDGAQMDLAVSGSDFGTKNYRSAFRYSGQVLQTGMPRNDALLHPDAGTMAAVKKRLGIGAGEKVLLYAPTFRDERRGGNQPAGFDLSAAEIVLSLRETYPWVRLTMVCPWNGQADKWEAADRDRWQQVLEASDKVVFICDRFEKGANFRRNSFLVDNTSLLLACYNGDPHSGTGQTIRYAHRRGIPVRILTPEKRKASA